MKVLLIDNYDSFTYNLVQLLAEILDKNDEIIVKKNNKILLDEISNYDKIVLSPGPGIPSEAGILLEIIKTYAGKKPIFGVCLGLQAIAEAFGGSLYNLNEVFHGVQSRLKIVNKSIIFEGIKPPILVGRYHSWVVKKDNLPKGFTITSEDENGLIMSIENKSKKLYAVQFHPESIMTIQGKKMISNWITNV